MEMKRFEVRFSTYDETEYCTVRISSEVYAVDPKYDMFLIWDSCNKRFDWIGMDGAKLLNEDEECDKKTGNNANGDPVKFMKEHGYCPICGAKKVFQSNNNAKPSFRKTEPMDDIDLDDIDFDDIDFDDGCDAEELESAGSVPKLDDLDFTSRSYNAIRRSGIKTIEQLCDRTEKELLKLRNLGIGSLENIKNELAKIGRSLKQEGEEQ